MSRQSSNSEIQSKTAFYVPKESKLFQRKHFVEVAKTILCINKLSIKLWSKATNASMYVLNATGTSKHTLWYDEDTDVAALKIISKEVFP